MQPRGTTIRTAVEILLDGGCWIDPHTIASASDRGSKEVFDTLIARCWNINSSGGHLGNALLMCAGADNLDMVQFLLSRGADPNAKHPSGTPTPLERAAYHASIPVLDALLNAGAMLKRYSVLRNAAGQGRTDVVTYLLDRGAAISEISDNSYIRNKARSQGVKNALCNAAWRGQPEVMKLLLERGADTSIKDTSGKSALELAEIRDTNPVLAF